MLIRNVLPKVLMLLLVAGICTSFVNVSSAATLPSLYVGPTSFTASSLGQAFPIQVFAYLVVNLTGFQFQLNFNTTLLRCLNATLGNFFPSAPNSATTINIDNTHGTVSIQSHLQGSAAPVSGYGPVLSTYFNASYATTYPKPRDSCQLTITGDTLYGIGNQSIQHATSNGTYNAPYAPPQLGLTVNTDKNKYYYDIQTININGTFTANNSPLPNALVALEIVNRQGGLIAARTLQTSTYPPTPPLQVTALIPCDGFGDPQSSFQVGSFAGFEVTVQNTLATSVYGLVVVNAYDSGNATLGAVAQGMTIPASGTNTVIVTIPLNFDPNTLFMTPPASGIATVFAGVWSNLVENGGVPLAAESQANFNITAFKQGHPIAPHYPTPPIGTYQDSAAVHFIEGIYSAGTPANYTIWAGASFMGINVTNSKQINMTLGGDVNLDGKVNLSDLVLLAQAYGTKPGKPKWNPACDFDGSGVIDLGDLVILASNYGKGTV